MSAQHYQVIVVGGGMAGLSACAKLVEKGIGNVLLIEGSDRLGGRINTVQFRKFNQIGLS